MRTFRAPTPVLLPLLAAWLVPSVICPGVASFARYQESDERDRQAIFTFQEVGGKVTWVAMPHGKRVTEIDLRDTYVTEDRWSRLDGLGGLRSLMLSGSSITNAGMAHVSGLAGLQAPPSVEPR